MVSGSVGTSGLLVAVDDAEFVVVKETKEEEEEDDCVYWHKERNLI